MNVLAGGQIHDSIGTPVRGPGQFLHLFLNGGRQRGIADVGIDLYQEVAPDNHRLNFRVIDIRGNDRTPTRHLGTNKFRRDFLRQGGAERLATMLCAQCCLFARLHIAHVLADGDELHFRRNDALTRVMKLGDVMPCLGTTRRAQMFETQMRRAQILLTLFAVGGTDSRQNFAVPPLLDPGRAQRRQACPQVHFDGGVGIDARGVVYPHRRIGLTPALGQGVGKLNLAHGNQQISAGTLHIHLVRIAEMVLGAVVQARDLVEKLLCIRAHWSFL